MSDIPQTFEDFFTNENIRAKLKDFIKVNTKTIESEEIESAVNNVHPIFYIDRFLEANSKLNISKEKFYTDLKSLLLKTQLKNNNLELLIELLEDNEKRTEKNIKNLYDKLQEPIYVYQELPNFKQESIVFEESREFPGFWGSFDFNNQVN